ncbi:MAG: cation-translocating P-type ATPase [Oscillospiraceae bacterium]
MQNPRNGLTQKQAAQKLIECGENTLREKKQRGAAAIFFSQFNDVLILILALASLFSVVVGQMTEAITIISIMILNAAMGFVQEYKTERTIKSLAEMTSPVARVIRSGRRESLRASKIVPGDLIVLKAGDRIPADARLIEAVGFSSDESMLTGESKPVKKDDSSVAASTVFMGTSVLTGHGLAVVEKTGMKTEMGTIADMLGSVEEKATPLEKRLATLGKFIAVACLFVCGAVVAIGALRGEPLLEMMLTGISLAVAAIPEGLPAIVTIVLALSVNRILARGAVIRKLHAVETLGSATVICSDKTGTITENKMTATNMYFDFRRYEISGTGSSQTGGLVYLKNAVDCSLLPTAKLAFHCAVLCSDSAVEPDGSGKLRASGNPTETALMTAAWKCRIKRADLLQTCRITDEKPFDSTRKMMSVVAKSGGKSVLFAKGAPDILLKCCERIHTSAGVRIITANDRSAIAKECAKMSQDALRVIATAYKEGEDGENRLVFLALFGLADPPRREVADAVRQCRRAGIRPIMITGDSQATALAVAKQVGIGKGDRAVQGSELDGLCEAELRALVDRTDVFARVTPKHKLAIVKALKANKNIVAMTGDGVNDAPALKEADIGVAMGLSGTDVAKEASDVVVLDDSFATIVAAVEEGRIIYQNIRLFIRFLLTSNLGEVLTVLLAMLLGMPAIFLPIQLLLINLLTDGLPAVALGMEPARRNIMERPPRPANESLFAGGLTSVILFRGTILGLCNLLSFVVVLRMSGDLTMSRSAAYLTLVIAQMVHVFECRVSASGGLRNMKFFANKTLLAACLCSIGVTIAVVYIPFLQKIFMTSSVTGIYLLVVVGTIILSPLMGLLFELAFREKTKK